MPALAALINTAASINQELARPMRPFMSSTNFEKASRGPIVPPIAEYATASFLTRAEAEALWLRGNQAQYRHYSGHWRLYAGAKLAWAGFSIAMTPLHGAAWGYARVRTFAR